MKAIRSEQGTVRLDNAAPEPVAMAGEAIVTPTRLAIDPNDARAVAHAFTGILGHEFVGIVTDLNLPKDDPLATRLGHARVVGAAHIPCRQCELCKTGLSLHCTNASTLGLDGRDGCFAKAFAIPASNLVPVPDALDDDRAVFAHALGKVLHAARLLRIEGKTFVSVLGDSPLALLAAQVMARQNASVRLLGLHAENLELCTKWSIKHRDWHEVGHRHDQDIVFDCTGLPSAAELAFGLVRPRGSIVFLREPEPANAIPVKAIMQHELQVFGSRGSAVAQAVAQLAANKIDVLNLIQKRLRFEEAPSAISQTQTGGLLKILFDAA